MFLAERLCAWIGVLAGVGLTILRATNGDSYDRKPFAVLAFGFVVAIPGILAFMARRKRPCLYLASGMIYPLISFMSIVTFPLLVVAGMALVSYGRRSHEEEPLVWGPLTALVTAILAVAAFFMLFVLGDDPICSTTVTDRSWSQSCTSDIITNREGLASLAVASIALVVGWFLSSPGTRVEP